MTRALLLLLFWIPVAVFAQPSKQDVLDALDEIRAWVASVIEEEAPPDDDPPPDDEPPPGEEPPVAGGPDPLISEVWCPEDRTSGNNYLDYYECSITTSTFPELDPTGAGLTYMFGVTVVIKDVANVTTRQLSMYLHASGGGGTEYANWGRHDGGVTVRPQDPEAFGYRCNHAGCLGQDGVTRNYTGRMYSLALDYASQRFAGYFDAGKGVMLRGNSMGCDGVWHQITALPERWRSQILIASCNRGYTRLLNQAPGGNLGPKAPYWEQHDICGAWALTDPALQNMTILALQAASDTDRPHDDSVVQCLDDARVAYQLGVMPGGHGASSTTAEYAPDPLQRRVGVPWVAFIASSHNVAYVPGTPAHYNLGLTYDLGGIQDSAAETRIPIRYVARGNIGMPLTTSTYAYVRGASVSGLVDWTFGAQSGVAEMDAQGRFEIFLEDVPSGTAYTDLVLVPR